MDRNLPPVLRFWPSGAQHPSSLHGQVPRHRSRRPSALWSALVLGPGLQDVSGRSVISRFRDFYQEIGVRDDQCAYRRRSFTFRAGPRPQNGRSDSDLEHPGTGNGINQCHSCRIAGAFRASAVILKAPILCRSSTLRRVESIGPRPHPENQQE